MIDNKYLALKDSAIPLLGYAISNSVLQSCPSTIIGLTGSRRCNVLEVWEQTGQLDTYSSNILSSPKNRILFFKNHNFNSL